VGKKRKKAERHLYKGSMCGEKRIASAIPRRRRERGGRGGGESFVSERGGNAERGGDRCPLWLMNKKNPAKTLKKVSFSPWGRRGEDKEE